MEYIPVLEAMLSIADGDADAPRKDKPLRNVEVFKD